VDNFVLRQQNIVFTFFQHFTVVFTVGTEDPSCVAKQIQVLFLNFRRVLNVICSFLGNSPASEF